MSDAALIRRPGMAHPAADARLLQGAATLFTVAVLLHNGDHVRRGADSVTADVFWLGTAAIFLEVAIVAVIFRRHPSAPLAAVATGFPLALGYLAVHFTPQRGWLSDSFPDGDVSALSWAAASLETAAAVVLGVAGLVVLRRRGLAAAGADDREESWTSTLSHPVVLAMALGNLGLLVGTFLTR